MPEIKPWNKSGRTLMLTRLRPEPECRLLATCYLLGAAFVPAGAVAAGAEGILSVDSPDGADELALRATLVLNSG